VSDGRILVIRGGAIGDFLLTLPVLAAVRARFPGNHLEVLGYPSVASLAQWAGLADAVRPLESRELAGFFARGTRLDPAWSAYFASFHLIVSYLFDPDAHFQSSVVSVSEAQFIQGLHRPRDGSGRHATDQLLTALQQLAIFDADPVPRLNPPAAPRERRLMIHPGSGSESKNWPVERWAALLDWVAGRTDVRLRLVGGEADADRVQYLARRLPVDRVEVCVRQPLTAVAGQMAGALGFLGHDSGISHLAAAVGLPGLVLWGPTDEQVWRPRSDRFETVRHAGGLDCLPVDVVAARLGRLLPEWLRGAGPLPGAAAG
jgi:heptosyltransferase-3